MVDRAWSALRQTGHGGDTILIGELAPFGHALGAGPGQFGYMVPLRFLRDLYCVDGSLRPLRGPAASQAGCASAPAGFRTSHPGLFDATGLALHPYSQGPPTASVPGEPDYANLPAIPHVESVIDQIFSAYGSARRLPIYLTEFGVHTNPPETVFGTVSPAVAAAALNQAEYLSWRDPRVRSFDQYLLQDPPAGNFATGLEFSDGRPKPGLAAYRVPLYLPSTRLPSSRMLEVWGGAGPARFTAAGSAGRSIQIQFRPVSGGGFRTLAVAQLAAGTVLFDRRLRFPGAGTVRLAWRPPGEPVALSRSVSITG
jgi:hypothetical protein